MSVASGATGLRPRVEAVEAATAGFKLMRAEPRTWLAWALVSLVFYAVIGVASFAAMGPQMAALSGGGATRDPTLVFAALAHAAPVYLLITLISFVLYAVFYAGVNRALLRPQEGGWRHLKLGPDELRQFAVFILLGLVLLAAYLAIVIVFAVVIGVAGAVTAGAGVGGGAKVGLAIVVGLLTFAMMLAALGGLIWLAVRLSLASPLTFDTGRVRIFGSWRLTRGVFWPLFGAYLLSFVFLALIALVPLFVSGAVAAATGGAGGVGGFLLKPDMTSPAAYFGPARIISFVLGAAAFPLYLALLVGAPASAYAQIVGSGGYAKGSRLVDARAEVFGPAG